MQRLIIEVKSWPHSHKLRTKKMKMRAQITDATVSIYIRNNLCPEKPPERNILDSRLA